MERLGRMYRESDMELLRFMGLMLGEPDMGFLWFMEKSFGLLRRRHTEPQLQLQLQRDIGYADTHPFLLHRNIRYTGADSYMFEKRWNDGGRLFLLGRKACDKPFLHGKLFWFGYRKQILFGKLFRLGHASQSCNNQSCRTWVFQGCCKPLTCFNACPANPSHYPIGKACTSIGSTCQVDNDSIHCNVDRYCGVYVCSP